MRVSHFASLAAVAFAFFSVPSAFAQGASSGAELLPPNAKPGECYARVFIPPQYETVENKVLKSDAAETLSIKPAVFDKASDEIVVEEASYRLEVVPATYGWVEEKVEISPAHTKLKQVPAVYETVTEKIVDKPAQTVWKKGRGPIEKVDNGTGEIMCLVEVPATYKKISKKVLKTPASVEKVNVPAKFKTVKRKVLKTPPTTRKVEIPAKTAKIAKTVLVKPAAEARQATPAQYQTVTSTKLVKDGRMDWKAVLCETNTTKDKVRRIQQALSDEGFNPGGIDGNFGRQTGLAIKQFQKSKGIAQGGITIETLTKLGVGA